MLASAPTFADISMAVRAHMDAAQTQKPFVYGKTRISLNVPTYGSEEVVEALDSLMTTWVTMGRKVKAFEEAFAAYCQTRSAIMTNSGSSANLLALNALMRPAIPWGLSPGDEVITPALTWATTVFPIAQAGLIPVLVDVDRATYNLDPAAVKAAITPKTAAIMPVHLLGNPCDMDALQAIAGHHGLLMIEDSCEAHGAEYHGRKTGSFGDVATFSFFFSHHISTVEGGMVLTNDDEITEACRAMRVFGWIRDLRDKALIAQANKDIDPRFLFLYPGFNFRPTEVQGAFGMHQLPRLEKFIQIRRDNAAYWGKELAQYGDTLELQTERPGTRHVWFAYPVMVRQGAPFTRRELMEYLENRGVETRPIEAGNMAMQPAMRILNYRSGPLPNAQYIHDNAFFFGNHAGIGEVEREAIAGYIHDFMQGHV